MEMNDDEINRKICELKNIEPTIEYWAMDDSEKGIYISFDYKPEADKWLRDHPIAHGKKLHIVNHPVYKKYATDPRAALTLVDEMPYFSMRRYLDHWTCQSAHCGNPMDHATERVHLTETEPYYRCGCRFGDGADFCHAVCNAYIAWMEAK